MQSELQAAGAVIGGLKAAFDLTKALLDVKGAMEVQGKVFELQGVILDAQRDMFAAQEVQSTLLKRIGALEKQVADLEAWGREKERYQLAEVTSGALAYRLKPEAQGSEPEHWLCANCYQDHRKSILQEETRVPGMNRFLVCHACNAEIIKAGFRQPENPRPKPSQKKPSTPWR